MVLRQPLNEKQLHRTAPWYKYNDRAIPQSFLDKSDMIKYLVFNNDKELVNKIKLIIKFIRKKYHIMQEDFRFIEWVEKKERDGWNFQYSVPYYRFKFDDPRKQKIYSDKMLRQHKMKDRDRQMERYWRLKSYYTKTSGRAKIPPAMAGVRSWYFYFDHVTELKELDVLDRALADILNAYEKERKEYNVGLNAAVKYFNLTKIKP